MKSKILLVFIFCNLFLSVETVFSQVTDKGNGKPKPPLVYGGGGDILFNAMKMEILQWLKLNLLNKTLIKKLHLDESAVLNQVKILKKIKNPQKRAEKLVTLYESAVKESTLVKFIHADTLKQQCLKGNAISCKLESRTCVNIKNGTQKEIRCNEEKFEEKDGSIQFGITFHEHLGIADIETDITTENDDYSQFPISPYLLSFAEPTIKTRYELKLEKNELSSGRIGKEENSEARGENPGKCFAKLIGNELIKIGYPVSSVTSLKGPAPKFKSNLATLADGDFTAPILVNGEVAQLSGWAKIDYKKLASKDYQCRFSRVEPHQDVNYWAFYWAQYPNRQVKHVDDSFYYSSEGWIQLRGFRRKTTFKNFKEFQEIYKILKPKYQKSLKGSLGCVARLAWDEFLSNGYQVEYARAGYDTEYDNYKEIPRLLSKKSNFSARFRYSVKVRFRSSFLGTIQGFFLATVEPPKTSRSKTTRCEIVRGNETKGMNPDLMSAYVLVTQSKYLTQEVSIENPFEGLFSPEQTFALIQKKSHLNQGYTENKNYLQCVTRLANQTFGRSGMNFFSMGPYETAHEYKIVEGEGDGYFRSVGKNGKSRMVVAGRVNFRPHPTIKGVTQCLYYTPVTIQTTDSWGAIKSESREINEIE